MQISYDHYRIFYYVAKYRSITAAAQVLMSNQPNVTRIIKTLEKDLGCTLFIRSRSGTTLTAEGERLFEHVKVAFEQIEAGEREISVERSLQNSVVSVGMSEVALHCVMLPVLEKYHRMFPSVRIRLRNHTTPRALSSLKSGSVDFAVTTAAGEEIGDFSYKHIKTIRDEAVYNPDFFRLSRDGMQLKDMVKYPLISLGKQTGTYEIYSRLFEAEGLKYDPDIEVETADQILPLVKAGLGIGLVPGIFYEKDSEKNRLAVLKIKEKFPERSVCIVKRKGEHLGTAAKELERLLISETAL
ncbi:MAG: LysR family transcriptional regulator [Acutalibacteraceae bacterium]|nr:LysR family transcriptional regulator [Acutalibacteraceae bacterium]